MRVLIVEDQARMARELQVGLAASGIEGHAAASAEEALHLLDTDHFDAMVVDIMLPGLSGLNLVRRLRSLGHAIPALFLSAKGGLEDRLQGLDAGGDDYLAKPCSVLEVAARLRAILRRAQAVQVFKVRKVADLVWDPQIRHISRSGRRIDLTPKEYAIMTLLLDQPGEVVPRSHMVQAVWGIDSEVDPNAVDVQILRLRRKVDDPFPVKLIHTLRGVGLVLEPRETA